MDTREYLEHLEDYRREPWGTRAVVLMLAQACAILCNVHRGKDTEPYKAEDFMPGERPKPSAVQPGFADLVQFLEG